jgi:uncharacterized protein YjbI with pentapeptide repeats
MPREAGRGAAPSGRSLPDLGPFQGGRLETHGDYVATDFVGHDFTGQDASDARFLECRILRCSLDGASFRRARILESVLVEVDGASVDLDDTTWRDCELTGSRLGAVSLIGATWTGVRVRGCNLGFLNLAGARLEDVRFEGCEIGSLDARTAGLAAVTFVGCTLDELNVSGASLRDVDLSDARLRSLVGVESLKGAIVSHAQLVDLAPVLAEQLGLEVRSVDPMPRAG